MLAYFLVLEYLFTWYPAAIKMILWTEDKGGWESEGKTSPLKQERGFQPWKSLQRHKWGFGPWPQCHPSWKPFWFYPFRQDSESEMGNCSFKTGTQHAVFSAKQPVIAQGNLTLLLDPLQNSFRSQHLCLCQWFGAQTWSMQLPTITLNPGCHCEEPWMRDTFHFQPCVIWMEIMQLAQAGAVWGCALEQEHRSCFLLPVFESSASPIRGLLQRRSLRLSFFRRAIGEEQQRILPCRKDCDCLASSQN